MKKKDKQIQPEFGDHETGLLVWQVSGLWEKQMKVVLGKQGLTYMQFVLLQRLHELETLVKPITQIKLAQYANTEPMLTSKALRVLEEKAWVRRKKDAVDTRANQIVLTEKGIKRMEKALESVLALEQTFFGVIDTKRSQFSKNLQKIFEENLG